jgi:ubiquinone/menaquinone biosynthesis C-methylase UbiE
LYEDGYENITNIDVSDVIIEQMQRTHAERYPRMQFLTMDVTAMTFPDESFDVVLDKGTLELVPIPQY